MSRHSTPTPADLSDAFRNARLSDAFRNARLEPPRTPAGPALAVTVAPLEGPDGRRLLILELSVGGVLGTRVALDPDAADAVAERLRDVARIARSRLDIPKVAGE